MALKVIHGSELSRCIKPTRWSIYGTLAELSLVHLYGGSDSAASLLALDWALSIATGTPWQGRQVTQSPVFYISGNGGRSIALRMKAWEEARGVAISPEEHRFIATTNAVPLLDPDLADQVRSKLQDLRREHGKPAVLFIDTLARNFGPGDPNHDYDLRRFIDTLRSVAGDDALRVVLHYTGLKSDRRPRGSEFLSCAVDIQYRIEEDDKGDGGGVLLYNTKMRDWPGWDHPLRMQLERITFNGDDQEKLCSLVVASGFQAAA